MNNYKIQMSFEGTEEDADSLRKELAQVVYDEFELGSVYNVSVNLNNPQENTYVMALCMVELESGFDIRQINKMMSVLPKESNYMPVEFHANNTSAYGFIDAEYYQTHEYNTGFINETVNAILEDMSLESPECIYSTPDGQYFYMGYFND